MSRLSVSKIKSLRGERGKRTEYPAGGSLYLAVSWTTKSWYQRFRDPETGKPAMIMLGPFTEQESDGFPKLGQPHSLNAARQHSAAIKRQLTFGIDPRGERRREREAMRLRDADTFQVVAKRFIEKYAMPRNRSWIQSARVLGLRVSQGVILDAPLTGLFSSWSSKPVSSISRRDIREKLDRLEDHPAMARLTRAVLSSVFRWLLERDIIATNPITGLPAAAPTASRDRVLFDAEIAAFWRACDKLAEPHGRLFKFLLLTGARRTEAAKLTWDEIEDGVWALPSVRSKNSREHMLPLPSQALELLPSPGAIPLVFQTANGASPVSGITAAKAALDDLMRRELDDLPPWRLHDLRRTAATNLARLGIPVHVSEAVLNHKSGTIKGVAAVYNRWEYRDEKASALQAWANLLDSIVDPRTASNVTALRR